MGNLGLYELLRAVPETAKKEIKGGRLSGKTDINPMWRIKALTEAFGACGFGWKYEIIEKAMTPGAKGEISAFVDINLYVKMDGEWSAPIPGTGGSAFVAAEKGGFYTSDECYKMALTDAISVACKALGVGADVYWEKDSTKYDRDKTPPPASPPKAPPIYCAECTVEIKPVKSNGTTYTPQDIAKNMTASYGRTLCWDCGKRESARLLAEAAGDTP